MARRNSISRSSPRNVRSVSHRETRPSLPATPRSHKQQSVGVPRRRGAAIRVRHQDPFVAPEDWHEPREDGSGYSVIERAPGEGFRHVLTEEEIRDRLAQVPQEWLERLEVVQLAQMTRKKRLSPCYGLQWGAAIYLYPIEESLVEYFGRPPKPAQQIEAKMFGGIWEDQGNGYWTLTWTESSIKDYFLNNVLIHELGHLIDLRNTNYRARERFAEWFAVEYGYRWSRARR